MHLDAHGRRLAGPAGLELRPEPSSTSHGAKAPARMTQARAQPNVDRIADQDRSGMVLAADLVGAAGARSEFKRHRGTRLRNDYGDPRLGYIYRPF